MRSSRTQNLRDEAYALHKQGQLAKAETLYSAALKINPNDVDCAGLLALCSFQNGKTEKARLLWQSVLAVKSTIQLKWRDINNALAAKLSKAEGDWEFANLRIPPWPSDEIPATQDVALAGSLAEALVQLERSDEILGTLESLVANLDLSQPESLAFLRWALTANQMTLVEAAGLSRLAETGKFHPEALLVLSNYHFQKQQHSEAQSFAELVAAIAPVYNTLRKPSQKYTIGVLNRPAPVAENPVSLPEFHFGENTPTGLANKFSDQFLFSSMFPFHINAAQYLDGNSKPDFLLNNWATAEILGVPDTLKGLQTFIDEINLPILNHPAKVAKTTRQWISQRLQGVEGLVVPKIIRVLNDHNNCLATAMLVDREIGLPLILRDPFQQMGKTAVKIETMDQFLAALIAFPQIQIYAIQYIYNPVLPGIFRKFRAAIVGDEIFVTHVLFRDNWKVHRERDETKRKQIESLPAIEGFAEEATKNPLSILGQKAMDTLQAIHQCVDLDIYGIDFDMMPDGNILLFETNAAMHISFGDKYGHAEVRQRMTKALFQLFDTTVKSRSQ